MTNELIARANRVITPALGWSTELVAEHAQGVRVEAANGRTYIDFTSGIAVTGTGHCHPRVVAAAKAQMERFIHVADVFYHEPIVALAERLGQVTPGDLTMFFFSNAGAEAVEGALKLARYVTDRPNIIAFQGAFHGRTLGTVSLTTSNNKYRYRYGPLLPGVFIAPYPYCYRCPVGHEDLSPKTCEVACIHLLERMLAHEVVPDEVAAVIIEPVQGEGGYIVPPAEFMRALRSLCDHYGILLIADEVQTGFGRTGRMFACQHYDVVPDIMSLGKGIASGFPLSAVASRPDLMKQWARGAHGTTYGGNPVSCAAALATLDIIQEEDLVSKVETAGRGILARLRKLQARCPILGDVRGLGYMIGLEFVQPGGREPNPEAAKSVQARCLEQGLVVITCGRYGQVIRLIPPLNTPPDEMETALGILERAIVQSSEVAGRDIVS